MVNTSGHQHVLSNASPGAGQAYSVVIPAYNKEHTIGRALDSVLGQLGVESEVVVVDDGSTDSSMEIVSAYAARHGGRIRLHRQENRGPAAARNAGARLSRFDRLLFLDADDVLLDGCLALHSEGFARHGAVSVSISSSVFVQPDGLESGKVLADGLFSASSPDVRLEPIIGVPISAICYGKEFFLKLGGYDERLRCWEVTDLLMRAIARSGAVATSSRKGTAIFRTPCNSQFERTRNMACYSSRFAENMLALLPELGPAGQRDLAQSVYFTIEAMLSSEQEDEFFALYSSLAGYLASDVRRRKMDFLARVPRLLRSPMLALRRCLAR